MNTLFDKIWDKHVVQQVEEGPTQLYIDRLYCHEVTSPQAFDGMRARGLKCFRPKQIFCMPDHNTPTHDQDKPIEDPVSRKQVDTLAKNAAEFGMSSHTYDLLSGVLPGSLSTWIGVSSIIRNCLLRSCLWKKSYIGA